jgi:hypothetical protein
MSQGNDLQLCAIPPEDAVLQTNEERQHLLMLLASCVRASNALEMGIGALSESRRCFFEAERALANVRPAASHRNRPPRRVFAS